jgi:hypothetical protein
MTAKRNITRLAAMFLTIFLACAVFLPTQAASAASITVTSTSDGTGGPECTLRDAILSMLTTDDFDASNLDPVSVVFADASPLRWAIEDVDLDGDMDFLFHFEVSELNLDESSTEAVLTGETYDNTLLFSMDEVRIVPILIVSWG